MTELIFIILLNKINILNIKQSRVFISESNFLLDGFKYCSTAFDERKYLRIND